MPIAVHSEPCDQPLGRVGFDRFARSDDVSQTLKTLEGDGFVRRKAYEVVPPHVEYSLTQAGTEVSGHVKTLATWLEDNLQNLKPATD